VKYISPLEDAAPETLVSAFKNHPSGKVQRRAHLLILSSKGCHTVQPAEIFLITRQTVSGLTDRREETGISALYDEPRDGRPPVLNAGDEDLLKELIRENPRSVKKVRAAPAKNKGKRVSESTVRRRVKKADFRWKRIRKSLKSKRNEEKFRKAQEQIQKPEERRQQGDIDVFYYDEAGFGTDPGIPCARQPEGQTTEVPAAKGQRLNVVGLMNKDNELMPFTFNGTADSCVVTACPDEFGRNLQKRTFVMIDNAPTHKSKEVISRIPERVKRSLTIKFLPSYSPELNLIEILWRKIKYEWMPLSAYLSYKNMVKAVENILKNFGSEYMINFSL
jgi:transposase